MNICCDDVSYSVKVEGNGEPLLLLHGFTGNKETWQCLTPKLSQNYQLIMIDVIGHGKTQSPDNPARYEITTVAHDMKTILVELGYESAHVLGYSMGGRLALSFACLYPERVRTLVLESASPGLETEAARLERKKQDATLAKAIRENGLESFVDKWENIALFESQKRLPFEQRVSIRKQRLANSIIGLSCSLLGMGTGSQPSWWDKLQELDMPVLLVTGELDQKFCEIAKKMSSFLQNGEYKIIDDVGHAIHVENCEIFGKIVSEFISRNQKEDF